MPEAPLLGLVLAGGESRRMGVDKGDLAYHGVSQREHLARLLATVCEAVFVSCRPDQAPRIEPGLSCLTDPAPGLGPMAGLLAAFTHRPDAAWLVVACDLPGLDTQAIAALAAGRGPAWDAVAFRSADGGPEPMAALWEPAMGPRIRAAAASGQLSLRDCLRGAQRAPQGARGFGDLTGSLARCHLLAPPAPGVLFNANTPTERDRARQDRT
jgi:molybdopterin-guanine dinucleotide biosynthesis protein A